MIAQRRNLMRWHVLYLIMRERECKIGAEIGIKRGIMTNRILSLLPTITEYYAVDAWIWYPKFEESILAIDPGCRPLDGLNQLEMDENYDIFIKNIERHRNKIKILKMPSDEACKHIKDESLDFCFIDANHSYEFVNEDIKCYLPKIKKGGLLGGHDYGLNGTGVKRAVNNNFERNEFYLGYDMTWWAEI